MIDPRLIAPEDDAESMNVVCQLRKHLPEDELWVRVVARAP